MPLYYFDIRDSAGFHRDAVGDDFESLEEARQLAQSLLSDIVREELPGADFHSVTCDVRDQTGRVYRGRLTYRGTSCPPTEAPERSPPKRSS